MSPALKPARSPRDTGFAVASCAVLAAYNNVIGAQPWHRRWYAPANGCAAAAALAAAAASGLTAGEIGLGRGAWRPGRLGSALAAATAAGWLAVAAVPVTRPFLNDKRVTTLDGRAARLPGRGAYPGGHRAVGGDRLPRRAAGRPAPGDVRARRDRRDERRVRRLAHPPDRRRAAHQRAGRRPRAGHGPGGRRRRGDRRGRRAAVVAAGPLGPPGRARAAAPGHQLRRPGRRLGGRPGRRTQ